jgi:CBS domain containing-hemolysin-like protein
VEDEFDHEPEAIVPEGPRKYLVMGSTHVDRVARDLGIDFGNHKADTLSGLLVERLGRLPNVGDIIEWKNAKAKVLEVRASRAEKVQIEIEKEPADLERGRGEEPEAGM